MTMDHRDNPPIAGNTLVHGKNAGAGHRLNYFAYGSNMSLARLRARVPSAEKIGSFMLREHSLRFHKCGQDGSGKCDAFATRNREDVLIGVLFTIDAGEKAHLDRIEGLGRGYEHKWVSVRNDAGLEYEAATYYATSVDVTLKPFSWYKQHVLVGARESLLPAEYIRAIERVQHLEDPDRSRDRQERALHLPRHLVTDVALP